MQVVFRGVSTPPPRALTWTVPTDGSGAQERSRPAWQDQKHGAQLGKIQNSSAQRQRPAGRVLGGGGDARDRAVLGRAPASPDMHVALMKRHRP